MAGQRSQQDEELHSQLETTTTQIENNSQETITNKNLDDLDQNSQFLKEDEATNEPVCYNQALDDDIRNRLNKLNGLSDLINSLERDFDEANSVFREILKCSTDRLSSIAKTLGNKSIRHGRIYLDAKLSVEQSQNDCQKACLQFEKANKDHQIAKEAIKEAELKLKEIASLSTTTKTNCVIQPPPNVSNIDFGKLKLDNNDTLEVDFQEAGPSRESKSEINREISICDNSTNEILSPMKGSDRPDGELPNKINQEQPINNKSILNHDNSNEICDNDVKNDLPSLATNILTSAALLSEELNQGIQKLIEAETNRGLSERLHLDQANKLMVAQENLIKLKREHGASIRRSQLYFEEARRFNAKLDTIKLRIDRISENIAAAKQAYAQTLNELERFSDELHSSTATTTTTTTTTTVT